jgi:hypothetical protein
MISCETTDRDFQASENVIGLEDVYGNVRTHAEVTQSWPGRQDPTTMKSTETLSRISTAGDF